jgi:hypothetical protein
VRWHLEGERIVVQKKRKPGSATKGKGKRKRPTTFSEDRTKHSKLRSRWRSWLKPMSLDLDTLKWKQEIFWELQEISKKNNKILKPGDFFNWMCDNYNIALTVGLRRFDDQDLRSRSLWVMLYEILKNPGVINRNTHLKLYNKDQKNLGNATFDTLVGSSKERLSQKKVRSDLKALEDAAERIRRLVNKRIAHFTKPGGIKKIPTYVELDNLLDVIIKILGRYNLLLTATNISAGAEKLPNTWTKVLQKPWLDPESEIL